METVTYDTHTFSFISCPWCYYLVLSTRIKVLLLFILMHPEKPLFFQSLGVYCIWHSTVCSKLLPAQNSHATCAPSPTQTVAVCYYFYFHFLFTWCFSSFLLCPSPPPLQSGCVGGEMGWILGPVAFPQRLLRSPLQTSQTILACRVAADFSLPVRDWS